MPKEEKSQKVILDEGGSGPKPTPLPPERPKDVEKSAPKDKEPSKPQILNG